MTIFGISHKTLLKRIAALLALVMAYESAAIPLAEAAMIAQPAIESPVSSKISPATIGARPAAVAEFVAPFKLPAAVGTTVEIHAPVSAGRLIYHIQDVHGHVAAQTNLSEMISRLESYAASQNKTLLVAVEGAVGSIDTDTLSAHPSAPVKDAVSSALLRNGFLLGEEHAAINKLPGRVKIVGVETPSLYNRNVLARERSQQSRDRILLTVREIKTQLNRLKEHNFNSLLNTLEKNRLAVEDGKLGMSDYLVFLSRTSPSITRRYPMVTRMLALTEQERNVDFAAVEKEGRLLVEEIIAKKSDKEVARMMKDATSLREGRLSPLAYYTGLLAEADKIYPSLKAYVAYLRNSEAVNPDTLFVEVQNLETEIAKDLVRHPLAYELYKNIRWIERQERFFSLNMIPQEWEAQRGIDVDQIFAAHADIRSFVAEQVGDLGYRFSTPPFSINDLRVAVRGAGDFYRAAEARDAEMVANIEKILRKAARENVELVFIAGGFHTPGVTRLLRARGLAYQVIRPQLDTQIVLNTDLSYPVYPSEARLLPERSVTDFLRPASRLPNGGTEAVARALQTGGRVAPRVDRPGTLEASATGLLPRLRQVWRPVLSGRLYTGAEWAILGAFAVTIGVIVAFVFRATIARLFRGSPATAAARSDSDADAEDEPQADDVPAAKTDTDIPSYYRQGLRLPLPPTGDSVGGSGGVIARLTQTNNLDVAKSVRNETLAASANLALVYVPDATGGMPVSRIGGNLYVPERFLRADSPALLEPTDDNQFIALDRRRVSDIERDAAAAAAQGLSPAQYHNQQMDEQYMGRLRDALNDPAVQDRFERAYPAIVAAEIAALPDPDAAHASAAEAADSAKQARVSLAQLAAKWYAESNSLRGRDVNDPAQVSDEDLQRANTATNNLLKLIELVSAVPESFYDETLPAVTPRNLEQLGTEDPSLSAEQVALSQEERDIALYFGVLPLRMFAGGSWTRGGLSVPAALVTPAQLATAGSLDLTEFSNLLPDLAQVARPILDRRLEVQRAAQRLGLPVEPGLANQRIEIGVSDSNSGVINQFFADAEFLGFPALTFRFFEQRTGKGFGFNADGSQILKQDDMDLAGPVTDVPYGHLELEITHNKPNSYYVLDAKGQPHQGGASLSRILASNRQVLIHHQISLLHAWRSGWSTRPEWIHYVITRILKGEQEYVAILADNTKSGQKGGLLPVSKGGELSAAFKAYAGIPAADKRRRSTIFAEGNQTKVPEGAKFVADRAGVWVNSAITAADPAALERVSSLDRAPLVLTVRANKTKRDGKEYQWGAAVYPDGASYGMIFNNTVAEAIAPNPAVRADGISDAERFEVKQPNEFRQALETADRQDSDPEFRAIATSVLERLQANRAKRPTQPISVTESAVIAALLFAAFYLSFGFSPLGIDAAAGYVSVVLGIAGGLVSAFGIVGAVINRSSVDVGEGTKISDLLSDPRFNGSRVQSVIDFAAAAQRGDQPVEVVVRKGLLAETDPTGRILYIGSGLLQNGGLLSGLRGIVLLVALAHERVHLSRFQLPATNAAFRFVNEAIAWFWGTLALLPYYAIVGLPAPASVRPNAPYLNPAVDFSAAGNADTRFRDAVTAQVNDTRFRNPDARAVRYVAIDADSVGLGEIDDVGLTGFVGINAGLHRMMQNVEPGSQVVIYTASTDGAQLRQLRKLVDISNRNVDGITYSLRTVAGTVLDAKDLFDNGVRANVTDGNTVILTQNAALALSNARSYQVLGIPHLAVATFTFSHYADGEAVLAALLSVLKDFKIEIGGGITNKVMGEIVAKLSA